MKRLVIKILALLAIVLIVQACSGKTEKEEKADNGPKQTYTCPMHPQIIKHEMDICPICFMDLVPFDKNSKDKSLQLDDQRQLLANISTTRIGVDQAVDGNHVLNGRLVVDPQQSNYIAARIAGRVVKLYVRETGVPVRKGQALYQIYSEQLATLQQEYLMALAQQQQFAGDKLEQQLVASAKQKLLLYGQTETQLKKLSRTGQKDPYVTVYATYGGVVAELAITQGEYVAEGSPIMRLEGYQQLWVEADLYPDEAEQVKKGQRLKVVVNGWEGEPQWMTVEFINPSLQAGTQLTQIRGSIPNPNGQWQPGLQVQVSLAAKAANASKDLSLPIDAVINDEKGQHVWVKTGKDSFEPKAVTVGAGNESQVSITSGLSEGEEVVVTGAYLLYSEYILKRGKHPLG
jgi:Cu(I)/Ag(I) efflux system membrane fusion protein